MKPPRSIPSNYANRNNLNTSVDLNTTLHSISSEKSFSSLFDSSNSNGNKSNNSSGGGGSNEFLPLIPVQEIDSIHPLDDDGIYLQISNLDQWYDEASLKHYLTNQLKPITPILSLSIETPSIAKIKVPSMQVNFYQ